MRLAAVLFLLIVCPLGRASAEVPTKTITIYNNTKEAIYPVLSGYLGAHDLWLQAQFKVTDPNKQTFCNVDLRNIPCTDPQSGVPRLYRAYINPDKGVLPGESVSILVPFYTQLTPTGSAPVGTSSGEFIDWWNGQRIFFYVGKTAVTGAHGFNGTDDKGKPVPPTPVSPVAGAAVPSCAPGEKHHCEPAELVYYKSVFQNGSIPFDFGEYTFAAAEGPPPGGLQPVGSAFKIAIETINFNVSAVDGIYLPIAMAATGLPVPDDKKKYLGSTAPAETFEKALVAFSGNGGFWPEYHPSYFSTAQPIAAKPTPQDGDAPYSFARIASANVVFAESYKVPAPDPPVLSSNTNGTPALGTSAQAIIALWNTCTTSNDARPTCQKIREVFNFFKDNYQNTCHLGPALPDQPTMLRQVYGWAEFSNCPPNIALKDTAGYDTAIQTYCELQYNYLLKTTPAEIFNPYTQLVHDTLKSNAYAFSIDDKAAFLSVPGTELVITVGGPNGLPEGYQQYKLPTAATIAKFCH
jgi:hypothetical protein